MSKKPSESGHLIKPNILLLDSLAVKVEQCDCDKVKGAKHEACDSSITERRRLHKLKVSCNVIAASRSHLSKPGRLRSEISCR